MNTLRTLTTRVIEVAAAAGALTVIAMSCSTSDPASPTPTTAAAPGGMQIANPASAYCIEQGGQLEAHDQMNWCLLPDGTSTEEWEFFRMHQLGTVAP